MAYWPVLVFLGARRSSDVEQDLAELARGIEIERRARQPADRFFELVDLFGELRGELRQGGGIDPMPSNSMSTSTGMSGASIS